MGSTSCSNKVKQKIEALCVSDYANGRCTIGSEDNATHFIVDCNRNADGEFIAKQRTIKYLKCILRGAWVLSKDWVDGLCAAAAARMPSVILHCTCDSSDLP